MPVSITKGVEVKQTNGTVSVKGPKGQLELSVHPDMSIVIEDSEVRVERPSD
ncbi:MAG: 50S ribosomal protein L6, partial [Gemmatimonadota bacterium]|nr:50S ribosomal protein L6 [Gemmatimonadota bacterium]